MKKVLLVLLVAVFSVCLSGCSMPLPTNESESILDGANAGTDSYTEPETTESTNAETAGQRNAVRAARVYLNTAPFSHAGLVKQLEFSKFSHEEAVYGADHCGADWNQQAAKAAKNYLAMAPFSRDGLISQLEFEGYTHEQAVYGVEANGY